MSSAIVVDDDVDTVLMFSEYLELLGVNVIGKGYDGNQAVKLFSNTSPDMVFLDVMMPEYDGFYALEKIKKYNPSSVVIMVTADITEYSENRLRSLCADEIVYKPFDMKLILNIIKRYSKQSLGIKSGVIGATN